VEEKMKKLLTFLVMGAVVTFVLLFCGSPIHCAIPHMINYQGMLTDDLGDPITDTLDLGFRIYNAQSNGDLKWSETQTDVPIIDGLFNVILGSVNPIDTLSFAEDYWLEIKVGAQTMPHRLKFTSVGYAYRALVADSALVAGSSAGGSGGWVDDGSVVRLQTSTDNVGIGTGSPGDKVEVVDGSMNARLAYHHHFSFPTPYDVYSGVRGTYGGDVEGFLGRRYYSTLTGSIYYGVYGSATTSAKNYGVYGSASGGSINWAGYFDGDVYASGNVGIGTVPAEKLHVAGDIKLNFDGDIVFGSNSTRIYESAIDLHITADDDLKLEPDDNIYIRKDEGSYWAIFDNNNERLGVGTTSPSEKLDVAGNIDVSNNYVKNYRGFPKPNYDSGYALINQGQTLTLPHNLGGSLENYFVDLWFEYNGDRHNKYYGGFQTGGDWRGAYWHHLTTSQIQVTRWHNDTSVGQVRVRIWVYD
jgi:hypothetical protein